MVCDRATHTHKSSQVHPYLSDPLRPALYEQYVSIYLCEIDLVPSPSQSFSLTNGNLECLSKLEAL